MRSLWRRFRAWWNAEDDMFAYAYLTGRADLPPAILPRLPKAETCERQIAILREIGASPRAIKLAEEVLMEVRARERE